MKFIFSSLRETTIGVFVKQLIKHSGLITAVMMAVSLLSNDANKEVTAFPTKVYMQTILNVTFTI